MDSAQSTKGTKVSVKHNKPKTMCANMRTGLVMWRSFPLFWSHCRVYCTCFLILWSVCLPDRKYLYLWLIPLEWQHFDVISSIIYHWYSEGCFHPCLTATAASTKTDNYFYTPPRSFFLVSLPLFLSVVGRSPWIIHQCEMKKLMDIEYPLWSGGQHFFLCLLSFLQLKRVTDLIASVFQRLTGCFTLCTYLLSSWFVTGDEGLEAKGCNQNGWHEHNK